VSELYDALGVGYRRYRRPDHRVAAVIHAALADASTVLNVGAVRAPTSRPTAPWSRWSPPGR
jgi:hypothetical protein